MLDIEDPYNYLKRARLSIPKFLVNASGDQFFLPDNSQFYYPAVQEEKRIRYVENSKHNLAETDAVDSELAWYQFGDHRRQAAGIFVDQGGGRDADRHARKDKPKEVKLWQAHNPKTRDFRVEHDRQGLYLHRAAAAGGRDLCRPSRQAGEGYSAFFVELTYDSGIASAPFNFTTEVSIMPDVLPFKWADAAAKYQRPRRRSLRRSNPPLAFVRLRNRRASRRRSRAGWRTECGN